MPNALWAPLRSNTAGLAEATPVRGRPDCKHKTFVMLCVQEAGSFEMQQSVIQCERQVLKHRPAPEPKN